MPIRKGLLGIYLLAVIFPLTNVCYAQETAGKKQTTVAVAAEKKDLIINRQLCHWFRADVSLGMGVAKGLHLDLDATMASMNTH